MTGYAWSKFVWADWELDPDLLLCSALAQALWMRMLCIMDRSEPRGSLVRNGKVVPDARIAKELALTLHTPVDAIIKALYELEENEVLGRDLETGAIFSRRLLKETHERDKRQADYEAKRTAERPRKARNQRDRRKRLKRSQEWATTERTGADRHHGDAVTSPAVTGRGISVLSTCFLSISLSQKQNLGDTSVFSPAGTFSSRVHEISANGQNAQNTPGGDKNALTGGVLRRSQALDGATPPPKASTGELPAETGQDDPEDWELEPGNPQAFEDRVIALIRMHPRPSNSFTARNLVAMQVEKIQARHQLTRIEAFEYLEAKMRAFAASVATRQPAEMAFVIGVERWLDEEIYEHDPAIWGGVKRTAADQGYEFVAQLLRNKRGPDGAGSQGGGHPSGGSSADDEPGPDAAGGNLPSVRRPVGRFAAGVTHRGFRSRPK